MEDLKEEKEHFDRKLSKNNKSRESYHKNGNILKEESSSSRKEVNEMGLSHWQRVLSGTAGGALITGGLWAFSSIEVNAKWLSVIAIAIGIFAIYYARYG